jgi:hypothetical protein
MAKKAKEMDCSSRSISPSDPKASASISDFIFFWLFLTVNSYAIMIQTGIGLAQRSGMMS